MDDLLHQLNTMCPLSVKRELQHNAACSNTQFDMICRNMELHCEKLLRRLQTCRTKVFDLSRHPQRHCRL